MKRSGRAGPVRATLARLWRLTRPRPPKPPPPSENRFIDQGDAARDTGRWPEAAAAYEAALALQPANVGIQIQCGPMHKEAGSTAAAEHHHTQALQLTPNDPDLFLQLGRFYKRAGRTPAAEAAYRRALALRPGWEEPSDELASLSRIGSLMALAQEGLIPGLRPRPMEELFRPGPDRFEFRRLGTWFGPGGAAGLRTLRGIEAIHGVYLSSVPLDRLTILLDMDPIYEMTLQPSDDTPASLGHTQVGQRKYVFNACVDLSAHTEGAHFLVFRLSGPHHVSYQPA